MTVRMLRYHDTFVRTGRPEGAPALRERSANAIRFTPTEDVLVPWDTMSAEHGCGLWPRSDTDRAGDGALQRRGRGSPGPVRWRGCAPRADAS